MKLGDSFSWLQDERDYWQKFTKVNWGIVHPAKYDNTLYSAKWYEPTNWSQKPMTERLFILKEKHKHSHMLGRYRPAPYKPFPTAENYAERMFKKTHDAIYGKGYLLDIPWTDYLGNTHYVKF
jgi:hypothetical protein